MQINLNETDMDMVKSEDTIQPVFEFKAKDGGWWSGFPSLEGDFLRVHFQNFSPEEDEFWSPEQFNCVNDVMAMIRPVSEPMQDSDCKDLVRGMVVCVACKRPDSDVFQFYDATLKKLCRASHKIKDGEESCPCEFEVEWLQGPLQSRIQFVTCGDICILKPGCIEDDPAIRQFLLKVIALGSKRKQNGVNLVEKAESKTSNFKRLAKRQKVSPNILDLNDFPRPSGSDTVLSGLPKHDIMDEVSSYDNLPVPSTSVSTHSEPKEPKIIDIIDLDSEDEKPITSSYDCPGKVKSSSSLEGSSEIGKHLQETNVISGFRSIGLKRCRPRVQRDWPESANVRKLGQKKPCSQSLKGPVLKEDSSSTEEESLKPMKMCTEQPRAFNSPEKPSESKTSTKECRQDQTSCSAEENISQQRKDVTTAFCVSREQMSCPPCLEAAASAICTTVKHVCFNCRCSHRECICVNIFPINPAHPQKTCHMQTKCCDKCGSRSGNKCAENTNRKTNYHAEHTSSSQDNNPKPNNNDELKLKVLKDTQILLVENLEKDVTSSEALQMVSKISHGALMVYIWPSLDFETSRRGYICYEDYESAASAYTLFTAGKFKVVSPNGRPWVVSRVELSPADSYQLHIISALMASKFVGSEETLKENSSGLSIVHRGTDEYATAVGRQKLYLEQKNHIRSSYKEFAEEEVALA